MNFYHRIGQVAVQFRDGDIILTHWNLIWNEVHLSSKGKTDFGDRCMKVKPEVCQTHRPTEERQWYECRHRAGLFPDSGSRAKQAQNGGDWDVVRNWKTLKERRGIPRGYIPSCPSCLCLQRRPTSAGYINKLVYLTSLIEDRASFFHYNWPRCKDETLFFRSVCCQYH